MCETKREILVRKKKDDIPGYDIIEKNTKRGKEGIMVAVKQGTFQSIEEISNADFNNILTVRIKYKTEVVRLVTLHAPQETDSIEDRTNFYEEIAVQVERCDAAGDKLIILGDFNARIRQDNKSIVPISHNGKLLHDLVLDSELQVANFSPKTTGLFTRIQRMNNGTINKSTIDYVLMKDDMLSLMSEMLVDEEKVYCPYRVRKTKKKKKIIFSDHCAVLLTIHIQPSETSFKGESYKTWHYTEEGYSTYKIESISQMDVNWSSNSTQAYTFWTGQFEKLLSQCFSKKTVKIGNRRQKALKTNKPVRDILASVAKKGKIQRKIVKKYMERVIELETRQEAVRKTNQLKQTMANLTEEERFSPNGYWKLKKAADKNLTTETTYTILKDNGVEVTGEKSINEAYKEEFQHRLRTRKPHDGWKEYVNELNATIRNWLETESPSSPPFTEEEMDKVISKLKKGKSPGLDDYPPEVFIYAGSGTRKSLLKLLNQIKESREIPEQWDLMKIVTIYKKKGSKKILKYYRGIFLAIVISKIFESLIKGRIEPDLKRINLLQAGSRPERGGADNLFLLRGCVDHYVATKQPLYITAYDYEQAFDSLWVEKCILALKNLGVSKEMLQLIYNLNKKAEVVVKTPYGLTSAFTTDPIVKQGTVLGSILCSSSTGEYCGRNVGVPVGEMVLSSLLYVDDVLDLTENERKRIAAHEQAVTFSKENNLHLSGTKCFCMAINNNGKLPDPMTIDGEKKVMPSQEIIYLGDVFNHLGNNDDLIKDRVRRGTKAIICITSLIQEANLGVHEVSVWLLLYRALFIATVVFNSQTWSRLRTTDIENLRVVQMKLLKRIFNLPSSTSNSFLLLELGVLPIEAEIHKRQLMYLYKILQLPEDDPVTQMFNNLVILSEDGENNWWTQVKPRLKVYGLPEDVEIIKNLSKDAFKAMVNKGVVQVWLQRLRTECSARKKTSNLVYEKLGMQDYLKVLFPSQAKLILKSRCQTLDIKTHNAYKFDTDDTTCRKCGTCPETFEHIVNCGQSEIIEIETDNIPECSDLVQVQLSRVAMRIQDFYDVVEKRTYGDGGDGVCDL